MLSVSGEYVDRAQIFAIEFDSLEMAEKICGSRDGGYDDCCSHACTVLDRLEEVEHHGASGCEKRQANNRIRGEDGAVKDRIHLRADTVRRFRIRAARSNT